MSLGNADADLVERIDRHYGREDVVERLCQGMRNEGVDPDRLTYDELCAYDHLHIGGLEATREVAGLVNLPAGARVLDVGSGIGGPARTLAHEFHLHVTGIDATQQFCRAASMFNERVGLSDRVEIHHGSALDMPFADACFDAAFLIHVSMNIENKARLFAEITRVLKSGGWLVFYEILGGTGGTDLDYPVPWSPDASMSFVIPPERFKELPDAAGLSERAWDDATPNAVAWVDKVLERFHQKKSSDRPPARAGRVMGPDHAQRVTNLKRNLDDGRLSVVRALYELR